MCPGGAPYRSYIKSCQIRKSGFGSGESDIHATLEEEGEKKRFAVVSLMDFERSFFFFKSWLRMIQTFLMLLHPLQPELPTAHL